MQRRPDSLRPRRCAGTPLTVAASLALTVGLLGTASAAHAAVVPTASPTPTASVTAKGAAFSATARGELVLKPGEKPAVGTQVKWTITVTNTGDVPLDDVARTIVGPGRHLEPGEALELTSSTTLNQKQLAEGSAVFDEFTGARTPDGVSVYARVRGRLALPSPTPTPTPTPTIPAPTPAPITPVPTPTTPAPTPTPPAPTPTTPAPTPTPEQHPSLKATARGELVFEPGEKPAIGTEVKWTITVTDTGDVALYDVSVGETSDEVDLAPGQTRELTLSTTLGQKDLDDRAAVLTTSAGGDTEYGEFISVDVTGRLALPTPTPPAPTPTPTPTPTPPGPIPTPIPTPPTPTPAPPAPTPTPTPTPTAAPPAPTLTPPAPTPAPEHSPDIPTPVAPAASGTTGSTTTSSKAAGASKNRLAETGSDAAGALSAAGILTALGALGVLVGRRRRSSRSTH
ncbi:LPXTG cell wall anchor domain-containing protein [Rathayibacter sp. VKM Ac-2928]|uniref:DUF7507 domain-containing protein n=1 Tax=Rathayibacter sp. VKM Ac-2928 TaxID=2929479 RepID=UPI001FB22A1A|nr:LPXTG cell wall anchor domain-containing protein [Rathayibacter sp. VKM Ac-2928]MCJ1684230.1 LPXTG cell wall anchor domain-containing protein [Rathayibacter sp. VKM Ac-2928]